MDLVVARCDLPSRIDQERTVRGFRATHLDRERTDQEPDAELFGQRPERRQGKIAVFDEAAVQLRAAIRRHQGRVLRREHEIRATALRLADQLRSECNIILNIVGRTQLYAGGLERTHDLSIQKRIELAVMLERIKIVATADMGVA